MRRALAAALLLDRAVYADAPWLHLNEAGYAALQPALEEALRRADPP